MKGLYRPAAFLIFFLSSYLLRAEGTKQLMPDSADSKKAYIMPANGNSGGNQRDPFALYNGDTNYRLKIYIKDCTKERIFFGLGTTVVGTTGGSVSWRIHKPDGTVVWTGTTPSSGAGFITYASQAYAGPTVINAQGYPAREVIPTVNGEYFMTFQIPNNSSRVYKYFDITVVDTTTYTAIPGRVFSKCWQLSTNEPSVHGYFGYMYPYSTDGIVTKFDPNGFDGRWFSVCCNESGCYPIGPLHPPNDARKSVEGWHNYPQYRIFLNDPDSLVFPSGLLGSLVQNSPVVQTVTHCENGTIDFIFQVTAPGYVSIVLQLSTLGPPFTDRTLQQNVTTGWDTISWDGYDGSTPIPHLIPNGSSFNFMLTYINGITHLPLWDVENNANGFKVALVRPVGPEPNFYWDDTNLSPAMPPGPTTSPPGGCVSSINPCHLWSPGDPGDNRTVNTWWYVANTSTSPVVITKKQKPGNLGTITGPSQICQGATAQFSVTADPGSLKYIWTWLTNRDTTIFPLDVITIPLATLPGAMPISVRGWNDQCGDGNASSKTVTILEVPVLTNAPLSKTICSGTGTNISLTATPAGASFSWSSPTPTCSANIISCPTGSSGSTINDFLTLSNLSSGTVTYHITPLLNGCFGSTTDYTVTVNPVPDILLNSTTPTVCSGFTTNIQLSSTVPGTTFSWTATPSSPNVTGFGAGAGTLIAQMLTNSGYSVETVTYGITADVNGCFTTTPSNYVVTVYPVPDVLFNPSVPSICSGQTTNIILSSNVTGTTYSWTANASSPTVTGYYAGSGSTIAQTLTTPGFTVETVTYTVTPVANGCTGSTFQVTVTINPKPHLTNNPMHDTICSGNSTNITLTSSCQNTTFTWTASINTGNITGFSNGSGNQITQTLTNTLSTLGSVKYTIHPQAGTCTGNDTDYIVYVKPTPHLTNTPASMQICNNTLTNLVLTSDVSGTLFTWTATGSSPQVTGYTTNNTPSITINDLLINTGYNIESVIYHIIPHSNGCDGPMTNYTVTVNPTPNLSNSPLSKQQCNNLNTNIGLTSNVSGTLFTWTATGSTPQVTGFTTNNTPSITINDVLVNTGTNIETVTYHITPHANNCDGIVYNYMVTVYPTPNLSNTPLNKSQCNNQNTNITLASNVPGTLFTWTATGSTPQVTGFTNNNIPSITINNLLTNSGYNIETVTYHITPHANNCNGTLTNYAVTVYPTPNLSNTPLNMQMCNNIPENTTLTSNVTGTLFTWTCTPSSSNVTGWSNNTVSPTNFLNQTLVNSGLNIESVVYHMTPHANGCDGPVTDFTVSVVQSPDVYFNPTAQTICSGQTSSIQVLSHVPGTTFTWTCSASSPNLAGYSNGGGSSISQSVTNSGTTIETVTYTVYPTVSGCQPGPSQNVILTVNPKPVVTNNSTSSQQCSALFTNIVPTSSVPGSNFTWTASGSSPNVTGFSNGSGLIISQKLTNSGFNIETVTYSVVPVANGCNGDPVPFTITVYPVPDVYFTPASQTICTQQTCNVTNNSHVASSTYTWTASGTSGNVSGFSAGSGDIIQQTLTNSSYNIESVTYHVTPAANGCTGTSANVIVTVDPAPVVSFTACYDPAITTDAQPIQLKGGIPLNGTYTGTGVTSGIFYPAVAGTGTFTLTYSYTNMFTCNNTATQTITVVSPPSFSCGNNLTDVRDNKSYITVQIGTQCWMAVNLDYGNVITSSSMQRDNCVPEKYCYNDNPVNCSSSGGLYQWDELMKYSNVAGIQGLCPTAWHVPSETEWNTLFTFYISNGFAGSPLKYTGYSGFNAFLNGVRFKNSSWSFNNFATLFWSSTARGSYKAWAHGMNTYDPSVSFYPAARNNAFSVRCIKD